VVIFPTEGRNFILIVNRPDCPCRAHSTSYSWVIWIHNGCCYISLGIYVVLGWTGELYLAVWKRTVDRSGVCVRL